MFYKYLAGLLIVFASVMPVSLFAQSTTKSDDDTQQLIEKFVNQMNRSAPIRTGPYTTLDRVSLEGKSLMLVMTISKEALDGLNRKSLLDNIQEEVCANRSFRVFLEGDYDMRYLISDTAGNEVGTLVFNKAVCQGIPISDSVAGNVGFRRGLRIAIDSLNQSCPMKINENVTLTGVSLENEAAVLYRFTISDNKMANAFSHPEDIATLRDFVRTSICSNKTLREGMLPHYDIQYRYQDASGNTLYEQIVSKKDCRD